MPENIKEIKNRLEKLEHIRQDFVANVSHELRTPLTVVRGYLELLIADNNDQYKDSLDKIYKQMHHQSIVMSNIVENLLLLSRLESDFSGSKDECVNVFNILKHLCDDARDLGRDKDHNIHLNADPNLYLLGNTSELKSVFSNIIFNAVKYTPPHGTIIIEWCLEKTRAVFRVKDTGIGIANKHLPRITERFYRVDKARSRESGGTGLGLAIVKHALLRHQSELLINSQLNKGSVFSCSFPADRWKRIASAARPS